MENIAISLNAVLPMFLIIGLGCLIRRLGVLSGETAKQANGMCFKVFMSTLLFHNVYVTDLRASFDGRLLLFCTVGVLAEFVCGLLIIPRVEPNPPARGVMLQAFFRANTVLLGLPICASLFGAESTGHIALMLAAMVPLFNVLGVISLELYRGGTPDAKKILRGVVTNPLVLGAAAGIPFALTDLCLPGILESAISSLANAATPLALLLMGASMNFSRLKTAGRSLIVCTAERLFLAPLVFISLAAFLGFRDTSLCAVMLVFAAPVAVNSYTMALQMDGDADLAGGIVLVTTALSCVTLFLWILFLKTLGLF